MEITIPKFTLRVEIVILFVVLSFIIWSHLICSCTTISAMEGMAVAKKAVEKLTNMTKKKGDKEGFTPANTNFGESSVTGLKPINTASWFTPNLTYSPGEKISPAIQKILDRPSYTPLPEGELDFFAKTKFSGECCGNNSSYSNSMGCACTSVKDYEYLRGRGGNNWPQDPEGY